MSDNIQVGATVEILQPPYLAGMVGTVVAKEDVEPEQPGDRWIIQIPDQQILVSLYPNEFRITQ